MIDKAIKSDIINYLVDYIKTAYIYDNEIEVPLNCSLLEEGLIDSFGFIDLISEIERKFSIRISDSEINIENFGSINKISDYVFNKIKD